MKTKAENPDHPIFMTAVFLVIAGYTDIQIAPVMGRLGTTAGYLLGKETKE